MNNKFIQLLKCDLTDAEIADAARDLARANAQKSSIETAKKEVDSQLKADIAAQDSIIGRLSALINTGHEYRNIECRVELDTPTSGRKTIVRLDTGEIVIEKPMTDADRQMVMDLQTAAEAAEEEARAKEESDKVIVTPPPVLLELPAATSDSSTSNEGAKQEVKMTITDDKGAVLFDGTQEQLSKAAADVAAGKDEPLLAPAATMGGTHQKKGKKAAAGDK